MTIIVGAMLVSVSGAATTKAQRVTRIDVSTRAAVIHYLHSIHVKAKGAVIERGLHNYAGAHCPGARWTCASTKHTVVQIAQRGGHNRFVCSSSSCSVVQLSGVSGGIFTVPGRFTSTPSPNKGGGGGGGSTATCIKTTGLTQSCSITQSNTTSAGNTAIVWEDAGKQTGLTQTAAYGVSINQSGGSGPNLACVHQQVFIDGSTTNTSSKGATATLEAHQSIAITQAAPTGTNTLEDATYTGGVAACPGAPVAGSCPSDLTQGCGLSQTQILTSTATSKGSIVQNENKNANGANLTLNIKQNCPAVDANNVCTGGSYSGQNSAVFTQTNKLTAIANSPAGATQWQSSADTGGILAAVHQYSTGGSTALARQYEKQCEDAQPSGLIGCDEQDQDAPSGYALSQTQNGPVKKTPGDSSQTGDPNDDNFTVSQKSQQDSDIKSGQTNAVTGGFHTDGDGTVNQTTTVDGQTTTNTQTGQDPNGSINCTGSNCTPTPPAPNIDSTPPNPSNSSFAEFGFSDTQPGVTFLCQIDNLGYSACTSPQDYFNLADGSHTFSVEAKNTYGNVGPATSYTWLINTAPAFSSSGSLLAANNVDVAEFGYGGMRSFTGGTNTGDGSGTMTVAGLSGTVLKALLIWNGPTNDPNPDSNDVVSFADQQVDGTNIGTASSNCWSGSQGPYTNSQSYEADVTSLITGDGSYDLSGFVKSGDTISDINGVSLIVFYNDGNGANNRNVVLWTGNDSNVTDGTDPQGWDETLSGVPYTGAGDPKLDFIVGDGQNFGGDGTDDGAISVNGTQIAAAGGIFQGASTPAGPASASGDLWDVESFALPGNVLSTGSNSLEVTSPLVADCLSLAAVAANMPAAAQFPVILQARHSAAQYQVGSALPAAGVGGGVAGRK